jgi:hypothetical protein
MATKDLKNDIDVREGLEPQALTTGSSNGTDVDTRGFETVTLLGQADTAFAGTFTIQEGDSTTAYSNAAADDIIGTNGVAAAAGIKSLGYTGSKRYVRVVVACTTAGDASASFVLGNPHVCKTGAN